MHAVLVEELAEVCRRDTEVSVPALRRHRLRAVPPPREGSDLDAEEAPDIPYPWADPGDTLGAATALDLILREAIVRRNHRSEPKTARVQKGGCSGIDWARSMDRGISVKRIGRGVLRVEGRSGSLARVSIGVDGLAFTVAIPAQSTPAAAIAERLRAHYQVDIVEESDGSHQVVLKAPRSHT